jgi:hypothetical protein
MLHCKYELWLITDECELVLLYQGYLVCCRMPTCQVPQAAARWRAPVAPVSCRPLVGRPGRTLSRAIAWRMAVSALESCVTRSRTLTVHNTLQGSVAI